MEWWLILPIIFVSLMLAFATGIPVAFAFTGLNVVGFMLVTGGTKGLALLMGSMSDSISSFAFVAVPMFFLLGEVLYHSRVIDMVMEAVDKWIGKIRARLLFVALTAGTGLATLSGAGMADTALLGSTLYPEMEKRGYDQKLSIGIITSAGLLAAIIPPSALAVIMASIAQISVGRTLAAGILPGLLMATIYGVYIAVRVIKNPSLAPAYDAEGVSLKEKLTLTVKLVPLGLVIFAVMGFILLGIATPSESAATGAMAAIVVTAIYGRLNFKVLMDSLSGVVRIAGMVLLIITGAKAFGQVLAFTGATQDVLSIIVGSDVHPIIIFILIQVTVLILGLFIDVLAIMLILIPIIAPIVPALGFDPIHFFMVFLLNIVLANQSPPFGLALFVLKGVIPQVSMLEIFKAQIPFILMDFAFIVFLIFVPQVALWLPGVFFD